ncbi:related to GWT1-GPI-anchored wall transfer protein [Sporisorium reilianum f. sp. reilianum]|uniref:GPI-anchored wall transfer protein 1 n=1 Tax=Sporisorium reilianum f. sp. reilianum TaxID=72559 RepID=A0A2N8UDC6_9BASI|nr:related to GWT1-GPI-anchored wall transfer protein [Sporisorium reilianum f. sp. reilianum]
MDHFIGARAIDEPLAAIDAVHRHHAQHPQHKQPPSSPSIPQHPAPLTADASSYKELKEAWIADQTGSSIHVVNTLGLVMLLTYAIWAVLRAKRIRFVAAQHRRQPRELANPILAGIATALERVSDLQLEYLVLVVPAVCAHTVLATHLLATNGVLAALLLLLIRSGPPLSPKTPASDKKQKRHWSKKYSDDEDDDDDDDAANSAEASLSPPNAAAAEAELPFRVSIDSAADAAHATAAPPNFYDGPGSSSRSDADLSIDTLISTAPASPLLGSAASMLSPDVASTSSFPSPTRRSTELAALKTTPMQLLHSRDGSDAQSAVSTSSAMLSPLARSVVDPWGKGKSPSEGNPSPHDANFAAAPRSTVGSATRSDRNMFVRPQPFLTVYRAHMMLVTVISILAVDFPVFPRFLSKCETWGTSWMDMGVGSFVFSLGIISALPFLKSPRTRFRPLRQQILSDVRKSFPLLVLGGVRVAMVKGVEYPEHVSEYGVHWNFFFTLAVLPFAATLSRPFARTVRYSVLGVLLSAVHQVALNATPWQAWALDDTRRRTTLAHQNKEGLTSMPGYLAVFYIGLDLGHYVLPLDPYFAYRKLRRRRSTPRTHKLAMVLASLAIVWWLAYALSRCVGLRVSRRLANLPYVVWVAAFNTSFLLGYVLVYMWLLQPVEAHTHGPVTPAVLHDLNTHALTVFLAANLLTGLVNVAVRTMYTRDAVALGVLLVYTAACCALARVLTVRGIRFKL